MFDPHCRYIPGISSLNPGKRVNYVESRLLQTSPDQAAPYACLGCDMAAPFQGTLFRLPLRTAALAATSKLCAQVRIHFLLLLLPFIFTSVTFIYTFLKPRPVLCGSSLDAPVCTVLARLKCTSK